MEKQEFRQTRHAFSHLERQRTYAGTSIAADYVSELASLLVAGNHKGMNNKGARKWPDGELTHTLSHLCRPGFASCA